MDARKLVLRSSLVWLAALSIACGGTDSDPVSPHAGAHSVAVADGQTACGVEPTECPDGYVMAYGSEYDRETGYSVAGQVPLACIPAVGYGTMDTGCVVRKCDGAVFTLTSGSVAGSVARDAEGWSRCGAYPFCAEDQACGMD